MLEVLVLRHTSLWSGCANECLRRLLWVMMGDDVDIDLLLMLGAQKILRKFRCTPTAE